MPKTILVSGSLAYDRIMNFPGRFRDHIKPEKTHVFNLSFEVETLEEKFGGTAGNIAYNLKLLGKEPKIISAAGEDFSVYKQHLKENKIDTSLIKIIAESKTAFANIITDLDDNQIAAFYPGALAEMPVSEQIPQDTEIAIVSPEFDDIMIRRIRLYKKIALEYIFDPSQQLPRFSGEDLRQCIKGAKVIIGNDYEISLILQKTGWQIKDILKQAKILIITYGKKGSKIYTKNEEIKIDAIQPKKFIDPTGAGDAYRAGFISGLVDNKNLAECGFLGSWAASKAIEYYGAQEHRFNVSEIARPTVQANLE